MSRILLIDDDPGVRDSMERTLRGAGYGVQSAPTGEEGFAMAKGGAFDVILSDMRMPGISGLDILRQLRDLRVDSAFIIMTGFGTVDTAVEAMKLGAVDFVQKPFFRDELLLRVRSATERRQLARQVDLLQRQVDPPASVGALIGSSQQMVRVKDLIARAGAAPGTVLITGETGTGKELVARACHLASPRSAAQFTSMKGPALRKYPWPGNVRELRNCLERAVLMQRGPVLLPEDLGLLAADALMPTPPAPLAHAAMPLPIATRAPSASVAPLDSVEREHLLQALEAHGWNVSLAARALQVTRDTLRYRMAKHGLQRHER